MGYSFRLASRVLLYAPSHIQDNTYHGLCYTSRGALVRMRNSSMDPPWRIDPKTHLTMSERSYHGATSSSSSMKAYLLNSYYFQSLNLKLERKRDKGTRATTGVARSSGPMDKEQWGAPKPMVVFGVNFGSGTPLTRGTLGYCPPACYDPADYVY